MLKVRGLCKRFDAGHGKVNAVEGVDFEVSVGEFFTLLGPSGCGKSTTLRCIAGLEQPDKGEIIIDDEVVYSSVGKRYVPTNQRDISMVFQSYAIWPHMTVFGNVAYPLEGKLSKTARREKVMDALRMLGIEHLADRPAPQLSGGQQQRVALARAIVRGAKVFLLDEPLSNLDAKMRAHMRVELRQLHKQLNMAAVYVTHDQEEAFALSDRVAVMNEGRIVEIDSPSTIYKRPKAPFTAGFVGLCNFLPGRIVGKGETASVAQTDFGPLECFASEGAGKDVVIIIRPEHIEVLPAADAAKDRPNIFAGTVTTAAFLGKSYDCEVLVGSQKVKVHVPSTQEIAAGEKVSLYLPIQFCLAVRADEQDQVPLGG